MSTKSKTKTVPAKKVVAKKAPLPGAKLWEVFETAKKQTRALLSNAVKRLQGAKKTAATSASRLKAEQDNLKKLTASHKAKPSKSVANQITTSNSKLKQAQMAVTKANSVCKEVFDAHAGYQDHLKKLEQLHKLATSADREWGQSKTATKPKVVKNAAKKVVKKPVKSMTTKTATAQPGTK